MFDKQAASSQMHQCVHEENPRIQTVNTSFLISDMRAGSAAEEKMFLLSCPYVVHGRLLLFTLLS